MSRSRSATTCCEGRLMVEAARKYKRICQIGTQSRSMPGMRDAIAYVHDGKLGKVKLAYATCYKRRNSIGKVKGEQPIRDGATTTSGAARPRRLPIVREKFHYDWHWIWDYGNGDLGNQGVHEMDKARWGLKKNELPKSVVSVGGRFGYVDDGETANTQLCVFDYGDAELIFEVRGLPTDSPYPGGTRRKERRQLRRQHLVRREGGGRLPELQQRRRPLTRPPGRPEVLRRRRRHPLRQLRQGRPQRQARRPELRHRRGTPVRRPVPPGQHQPERLGKAVTARRAEGHRGQQGGEGCAQEDDRRTWKTTRWI